MYIPYGTIGALPALSSEGSSGIVPALVPDASSLGANLDLVFANVTTYQDLLAPNLSLFRSYQWSTLFFLRQAQIIPISIVPTTFFDYLVSDLPAVPILYDGQFSYSNREGSYHAIMGVLVDPQNPQEPITYFCMKRATSVAVQISPPLPLQEAAQITSRYAKFWTFGSLGPEEAPVPDQYCRIGYLIASGPGSVVISDFSYQVYSDWVVFEGRTREECSIEITIRKVEAGAVGEVVKREVIQTQDMFFRYQTHLPPGEYTYEVFSL